MLEVVLSNRFKKDLKLAAFDQLNDEGQTKAADVYNLSLIHI